MVGDAFTLPFEWPRHNHLRLSTALAPGSRLKKAGGGPAQVRHTDRGGHGRAIRDQTLEAIEEHRSRSSVLGVDPELVVVLEFGGRPAPDLVEQAGLAVLEIRSDSAIVAFSSDPELAEFRRRCDLYQHGPRHEDGKEKPAPYEKLFDAVEGLRPLSLDDVVSRALLAILESVPGDQGLRLDVQCWCSEDFVEARRRHDEVAQAVRGGGGSVLDASLRVASGLSVLRVELPASAVRTLARVDRIRRIDVLPKPVLSHPQFWASSPDTLPLVTAPGPEAATAAVIDSGIRSAHPLLAPAVVEVDAMGGLDGSDASGHGSLVASLVLHGSLEPALAAGGALTPAGRLVSVQVLDADDRFPDVTLWEEHLLAAIERAADSGARVINLSLGDNRQPYRPPRPTPLASMIDSIARERDLVIVVSAGNFSAGQYNADEALPTDYAIRLLGDDESGLLDPASAALALTVGALCADGDQGVAPPRDTVATVPLGRPGLPSPLTRVGPGVARMVKPDISAPGGSVALDHEMQRLVFDSALDVVGAGGTDPERLLARDRGTSFAAPLVSHAALRVLGRYPGLSANAVRALVLAAVEPVPPVVAGVGARAAAENRRIAGYGRVSAARAESSSSHRAVLLAESKITVDGIHIYSVPIPSTFFRSGGFRRLVVALAHDPEVRPTRLDYLSNRMTVHVFRGIGIDLLTAAYAEQIAGEGAPATDEQPPPTVSRFMVDLQPSATVRSRGANQYAMVSFEQKLRDDEADQFLCVVRNTNRWAPRGGQQRYAMAVGLERDEGHADLYDELKVQLEAMTELEVEIR